MAFVITTKRKDFKLLGRRAGYSWEVLSDRLGRELGREYGLLLAEPVLDPSGGYTDWYTDFSGSLKRISDLGEAEASALLDQLHAIRLQINGSRRRIEASGQRGGDKGLADALRRATVVPDESRFVWSAHGHPVLVAWGMVYVDDERLESALVGEGLLRRKKAGSFDSTVGSSAASDAPGLLPNLQPRIWQRTYWSPVLWLLFVGLMGSIYFLLLKYCGIFVAPEESIFRRLLPIACHAPSSFDAYAAEHAERAELDEKIRKAELDLARIQGVGCLPEQSAQIGPREFERRLAPTPAQTGDLQISLAWNGLEDLDLHVICPGGELSFGSPNKEACGGKLDVDQNSGAGVPNPVENAVWSNPPHGQYEIVVQLYSRKDQPPRSIPFTIRLKRGNDIRTFTGTVSEPKESRSVFPFTL